MKQALTGLAVWVESPGEISLRRHEVKPPGPDEVTVSATVSLISPGTELLVYRGHVRPDTDLDLETCEGSFAYPVKYGYQVVGRVLTVGSEVPLSPGLAVFARHPHQTLFTMRYDPDLISVLPPDLDPEAAAFSNMMSVALNALLDVPVRVGDDVVVFGQGPVGLFISLLAARTANQLWVVEPAESRRDRAEELVGATCLSPDGAIDTILEATEGKGVDVVFEASGAPEALQQSLRVLGVEGSLAVVAYYGEREVPLLLSPEFHFRRQRIVSSQAGIVGSGLQPRWNRLRRLRTAWSLLEEVPIESLVSHRFDIQNASEAYRVLAGEEDAFGILFDHSSAAGRDHV